jgi:hypothetical protein
MPTKTQLKQTKVSKIDKILTGVICLATLSMLLFTLTLNQNWDTLSKSAQAAAPNTAKLIIGTTDNANSVDISVCVQATDGPIHLANVSTWFQFNTSALTPTTGTFVEKGRYNGTDGYGQLKWNEVAGSAIGGLNKYTMSLVYSGDGVSAGQSGLLMSVSSPELLGKVSFAKVAGATASTTVTLVKNIYYSTESPGTAIQQTITNVIGDCRGVSTTVSSSSSSTLSTSSSVSANTTYTIGTPVATATNPVVGLTGGLPPVIVLNGNTAPNGTPATLTLPGSTTPITGTIVNGTFVPNPGQTIPAGTTIGAGTGILTVGTTSVNIPFSATSGTGLVIGTPMSTSTNPTNGAIGAQLPNIVLTGATVPNNTPAIFTPAGTTTQIYGTIINGTFVPNPGQIIPTGATTGPANGVLSIGNASVNIPTNFTAVQNGGGGVITICAGTCPVTQTNTTQTTTTSNQTTTTNAGTNNTPVTSIQSSAFKSKIKITDPYVCGQGAYGNVTDPRTNGVEYVYYEFYKDGATTTSYNYKLKMNDAGDFYLPISKTTNVIADGSYRILFYAYDKDGNKAQGEYTAQIASDCTNAKVNGVGSPTVRSGGLQVLQSILLILTLLALIRFYKLSKTEEITLKM